MMIKCFTVQPRRRNFYSKTPNIAGKTQNTNIYKNLFGSKSISNNRKIQKYKKHFTKNENL